MAPNLHDTAVQAAIAMHGVVGLEQRILAANPVIVTALANIFGDSELKIDIIIVLIQAALVSVALPYYTGANGPCKPLSEGELAGIEARLERLVVDVNRYLVSSGRREITS